MLLVNLKSRKTNHKIPKKTLSVILSLCMLFSVSAYAASNYDDALPEYVNNEIFVMYKDGSSEVIECENSNGLSSALDELAANGNVLLYQPNYSYNTASLSTNDELIERGRHTAQV